MLHDEDDFEAVADLPPATVTTVDTVFTHTKGHIIWRK
jgi:hypothetical protein